MSSSPILSKPIIKRKKPTVAPVSTMDCIAPDNKPSSLPPATLKAIADAKERGEYLQDVDCYWCPVEANELVAFKENFSSAILRDYRKRHYQLEVADLPRKEARLIELEEKVKTLDDNYLDAKNKYNEIESTIRRERNLTYSEAKKIPEVANAEMACKKAYEPVERNRIDIYDYKNLIKATKEWMPQRRIVVSFTTNYHTTDKTIADINKNKSKYPSLASKLVQVINYRKEVMEAMNKSRSNPMRNIYISIVLTPMDFKADCSWTIHRSGGNDDWNYYTHYLHITEYNLAGTEAVEFKSKEQLMTDAEKEEAEAKKKRLAELKKVPYADYFLMSKYDIGRAITKDVYNNYNIDALINDEDWFESTRWNPKTNACDEKYQTHSITQVVVSNVNYIDNTFTIIGYMYYPKSKDNVEPYIKKSKIEQTITYPAPSKRAKTTQLQKDLKKLAQSYEIPK